MPVFNGIYLEVGDRLNLREQITALPVGAEIAVAHDGHDPHRKLGHDLWQDERGGVVGDDHFALMGHCKVISLPTHGGYSVGDGMFTESDFDRVPVGTVIGYTTYDNSVLRYTKQANGTWYDESDSTYRRASRHFDYGGANVILSLPDGTQSYHAGMALTTTHMRDTLPLGTVLIMQRTCRTYRIVEINGERTLCVGDTLAGHPMSDTIYNGSLVVHRMPEDGPCSDRLNPTEAANLTVTVTAPEPPPDRLPGTGRLLFLRSEPHFSTYRDAEGMDVYLANGEFRFRRLAPFEDILQELSDRWQRFMAAEPYWYRSKKETFLAGLRDLTFEREAVDDLKFCADCSVPDLEENLNEARVGVWACDGCYEDYYTCVRCDGAYRNTTTDLNDDEVCSDCRDNYWSWCEQCDGYYNHSSGGNHDHMDCPDECASPALEFSLRNDGSDRLNQDTRVTITLPAGTIAPEGIGQIAASIRSWAYRERHYGDGSFGEADHLAFNDVSLRLSEIGDKWQTKEGNFTKRLSRFAYKEHKVKVPPALISEVGNIAAMHSTEVNFDIEVTRDLNLPRQDFVHEDSCWWTDYYQSRCALKTNGGFALRAFNNYDSPVGRAWVMPLRWVDRAKGKFTSPHFEPTFDTERADAFVLFNGYGTLNGYGPARLLAHMVGMTYRKVGFACDPMYVNSDSGYLITSEDLASKFTDGHLSLSVQQHSNLYHSERVTTNV